MTPEERIARLEQQMNYMEFTVNEMRADIKGILAILNEAKGGWKGVMWVAGISATLGAVLVKAMSAIPLLPRV